jgi:carbamoyltransferase
MNILGINFYYHDSTACIISNGNLVVAIEEERITRKKHSTEFPVNAINKCMEVAGLKPADIDYVAVSIDPTLSMGKKVLYGIKHLRRSRQFIWQEGMLRLYWKRKRFSEWYQTCFKEGRKPPVHYIPHHLSHVVGTYLISPYESAALLSVDGSGEWATTFMGQAKGVDYTCFRQDYFPFSLGSVYEAATQFCGFIPNYDEGKTMGLAPLGDPLKYYNTVSQIFWINDDLSIGVDLSYFKYQYYSQVRYSSKFIEAFGPARAKDKRAPFEQNHLDVAAAFQFHLEECMLKLARGLHKRTGEDYLVISGGVALNSVANGRIVRESGFKDIYLMPAAGDNGTALGAAYYLYNCILKNKRGFVHKDPYVGTSYSNKDFETVIKTCKLPATWYDNVEEKTAEILQSGKIVGFKAPWKLGRVHLATAVYWPTQR